MALADNYAPTKDLGDASTVVYTADWNPISTDYVSCYFESVATGVQTLQTGVTFEKLSNDTLKSTLPAAATSSYYVILSRDVPAVQGQSYTTSSGFPAKTVESTFDKTVAMIQGSEEKLDRAVVLPIGSDSGISTDLPTPEVGKYIGWNSTADGLQNYTPEEIDGNNVADGAITTTKLADNAVTAAKMGNDSVDGDNIIDDSIDSEHIVDGSVDAVHLASDSVSTIKIVDEAVTADKIVDNLVFNNFPSTPSTAPDANYEVANKKYVDDEIDSIPAASAGLISFSDSDTFSSVTSVAISETGSNGDRYKCVIEFTGQLSNLTLRFNGSSASSYESSYDVVGGTYSSGDTSVTYDSDTDLLVDSSNGFHTITLDFMVRGSEISGIIQASSIGNSNTNQNVIRVGSFNFLGGTLTSINLSNGNNIAGTYYLGKYNQS